MSSMSNKRFWWSVLAVWAVMVFTDYLFHGVWLQPLYQATAKFWRPMDEMQKRMPALWFGQLIFSWAFVWIYSNGINKTNQWGQALRYALAILLVSKVPEQMSMWATSPFPRDLVIRWFFISTVQAFAASFVMTWTFKPMAWVARRAH